MRGPVGKSRMHADGGIEVGIGRGHDGSHGASCRHPCHVDPLSIDVIRADDLPRDPGDEGRFALATMLVGRLEPVPTLRAIGRLRLLRIGDKKSVPFREHIHTRAGGKING